MLHVRGRGCVAFVGGLVALALGGALEATEYPGAIPGGFSVSDQGAGTYSIPIATPAATGGLRPNLALTYNHLAGDGLAGLRWTLSGFPVITRCGRTWAQDAVDDSISYDSGDRFCLDGQRLVVTSGSYGANGSVYSTEIESFQRIKSFGTAGSGPQYFTVEHGDGSISYYGYTTDTRIEYVGSSSVRAWYLSHREDQFGNRISYYFDENTSTGEAVPDEILWTSNSGQGLTVPRYKVEVVYETRPSDDQRSGYDPGGAKWAKTKRIDKIRVWYNGSSEIATYDLAYSASGVSGRSQLDTVTLSRGSDTLPETIFTWQDGAAGWGSAVSTGESAGSYPLFGDFNNDGREDIFFSLSNTWRVYRGRTDGDLETAINSGISSTASPWLAQVMDYDGDGKTDLVYVSSNTWHVAKSTGTGFATPVSTGVSTSTVGSFMPIDYDGDGLDDWVYQAGTAVKWRRNTGGSFGSEQSIVDPGLPLYWSPHWSFPDLNGDGRAMLYFATSEQYCDGPIPPYCYYISSYAALELAAGTYSTYASASGIFSWAPPSLVAIGIDINGDGLGDALYTADSDSSIGINNGVEFGTPVTSSVSLDPYGQYLVADHNNDGREDLLYSSGGNWYIYPSTGTNLATSPITLSSSGAGTNPGYLADINGDGLDDIVQINSSNNWNVHLHNGGLPDVVTSFENGLGHETDVTYQTLSQTIGAYYYTGQSSPTGPYVQEFNGTRSIVTNVSAEDGIGGTHDFGYYYGSAFLDRSGRGWLSFYWRVARDLDSGTEDATWFRQDFPYAGAPELQALRRVSDAQHIRESDPTWDKTTNTTPTPDIHFIRPETTTSKEWEVGGTDDGDLIRTVVDNPTFNTTYGYVEERTVTTTDPSSNTWTSYTDYNPTADTDDWCLGLPGQIVTTNTKPDSTYATRSLTHSWNSSDCSLTYTIDDSDSNTAKQLKTSFTYDGYGNPNVVSTDSVDTYAQNRSVDYDYDSWGHFVTSETIGTVSLATTRTWDYVNAQPATVTGADGLQVSYSYDSFGRLASENTPGIDTAYSYVAYTSWPSGNVYYVQAAGSDGSYRYDFLDALNRPIASQWLQRGGSTWGVQLTEYNTLGQVARASRPLVWGDTVYWVDYTYDLIGRVIEEDAPINEGSSSGAITTTQYLGESVWVTDAENHTTKTETNAVGQIVKVTDAANSYATYTYKPFGELASMTDAESNTTTISYDARGFKSGMSDPNMGDWSYAYSLYGELSSQTNALSQTTTLTYDEAGRIYQRSEAEGTTTWSYYTSGTGAKGKPSSISAPGSYAEYFWYDTTTGQPSQHQRVIDSVTYQYNMTYDGYGRLNELTYPTSTSGYRFEVDYDYDGYGHLQYVKDGNETYTYYTLNSTDALGRPLDVDLGNGRSETWDFDKAAGYLENIQVDGSVQNLTMTYDEVGNVLSRYDSLISKTESFGYDTVNRLTSTQVTGQSSVSVAYSAAGRITSKTGLGSYSYGAGSAGPFAVTSANSVSYTYDANGRTVTRGSGEIDWYSYDLPSKIDDLSDSSYTEFWYGPDRSRIKQYQSASGATITYAGTLFEFEDAATDTYRHYVQAGDKVIAVVERVGTTNTRQYLHRDHQGSVVKVTDAAGSLLQSLAFDAWGLRRNASDWSALGSPFAGSHETERGYTGHEHLDTVGLIHMNGRVQDPILGRFVSADRLIQDLYSSQSHNRFSYVWNNPGTWTDPSGFSCTDPNDGIECITVIGHRPPADFAWFDEWLASLRGSEAEEMARFLGISYEDLWAGVVYGPWPTSPQTPTDDSVPVADSQTEQDEEQVGHCWNGEEGNWTDFVDGMARQVGNDIYDIARMGAGPGGTGVTLLFGNDIIPPNNTNLGILGADLAYVPETVAGMGGGLMYSGTALRGSNAAGTSFSHMWPHRSGGPRSVLNGRVVSNAQHAAHDSYYFLRGQTAADKLNPVLRGLDRVPPIFRGGIAGTILGYSNGC